MALAEKLQTEIINADSMQVYKYFDIGTAKPPMEFRRRIVHHLIDILEPDEDFNAFDFKVRALKQVREILKVGKIPIVAGGAGLYLKVLTQDHECASPISEETKNKIQSEIREKGVEAMHEELKGIDPLYASSINTADALRIERALGVYRQTGRKFSEFHEDETPAAHEFPIKTFLIQWDRQELYDNIDRRVDEMMKKGLVDEVRGLLDRGFCKTLKPFNSIGYAQLVDHLAGSMTLDRAVREIKQETRRYAKRQITWFKKVPGAIPIPAKNSDGPESLRDKILSRLPQSAALVLACIFSLTLPPSAQTAGDAYYQEGVQRFTQGNYSKAKNLFLGTLNADSDPDRRRRANYLLGHIHLEKNNTDRAVELFMKSLKEYPKIEDHIRLSLAKSFSRAGENKSALQQVKHLLENFPHTVSYLEAQLLHAKTLKRMGQTGRSIEALDEAMKWISKKSTLNEFKEFLPKIIFQKAQLHLELGQNNKAHALYRNLYTHYPAHPVSLQALPEMKRFDDLPEAAPVLLNFDERSLRIKNLLAGVRYNQVIKEVRETEAAGFSLPTKYYFYLADAYKGLRKRPEAIRTLKAFLKLFPKDRRKDEARYRIGQNLWNIGEDQAAIDYLKKVGEKKRVSNIAIRSQFIIGRIHEGNKRYTKSLKQYNHMAAQFKNAEYAQRAAWRMGWIHFIGNDFQKAQDRFKENARLFPKGDFIEHNLFWWGKSLEKLGKGDAARKIYKNLANNYPYTFYGARARERSNAHSIPVRSDKETSYQIKRVAFMQENDAPIRLNHPLTSHEKVRHSRAMEMIQLGFYENAKWEIRYLEQSVRKNLAGVMWLSSLYNKAKAFADSVRLLYLYKDYRSKQEEKDLSDQFWKYFFPLAYAGTIQEISRRHNVDPHFVKSLIRQESLFDAQALSGAGARGLMQIMPETGQALYASDPSNQPFDKELLFDPQVNIQLGIKYLSQLNQQFGSNGVHILISYNAGPHVLKKWLKRFRSINDQDVFIESIPYPETRRYVKHVLRNHGVYKRLYEKR